MGFLDILLYRHARTRSGPHPEDDDLKDVVGLTIGSTTFSITDPTPNAASVRVRPPAAPGSTPRSTVWASPASTTNAWSFWPSSATAIARFAICPKRRASSRHGGSAFSLRR